MKTVLEYGIVEQQLLDMGQAQNLTIKMMESGGGALPCRLVVFPDETCRAQGAPFELHGVNDDDVTYYSWEQIQAMYIHSIHERVNDIEDLLNRLDEDASIMGDLREGKPPYIDVMKIGPAEYRAALMCWNGCNFELDKTGITSHDTMTQATNAALSWGKVDGIAVIVKGQELYNPQNI